MGLFNTTVKCEDIENRTPYCPNYKGMGRCDLFKSEQGLKSMKAAKYHKSGNTIKILNCPIKNV